jgi:hypothetical protein
MTGTCGQWLDLASREAWGISGSIFQNWRWLSPAREPSKSDSTATGWTLRNCFRSSSHFSNLASDQTSYEISAEWLLLCTQSGSPLFTSRRNSSFRAFRFRYIANLLPIESRVKRWGCLANPTGICRRCYLHFDQTLNDRLLTFYIFILTYLLI